MKLIRMGGVYKMASVNGNGYREDFFKKMIENLDKLSVIPLMTSDIKKLSVKFDMMDDKIDCIDKKLDRKVDMLDFYKLDKEVEIFKTEIKMAAKAAARQYSKEYGEKNSKMWGIIFGILTYGLIILTWIVQKIVVGWAGK